MANQKLTQRTELTNAADNDLIHIVDVSDSTDSAEGTSKKIEKGNLLSNLDADTLDGVQGSNYARTDISETFNGRIVLDAAPAEQLRFIGNGTGDSNSVFLTFYESDGTTRQGYVGFGSSSNSSFTIRNDVTGQSVRLIGAGGVDALKFFDGNGTRTVWHSGNDGPFSGLNADLLDGYHASAFVFASSDERLKENIEDYKPKEIKTKWRTFDFKEGQKNKIGVIAQELQKEHPEFVNKTEDGTLTVDYISLLVAKIAQQEKTINELINRIKILENK